MCNSAFPDIYCLLENLQEKTSNKFIPPQKRGVLDAAGKKILIEYEVQQMYKVYR